ncbi:S9 family peptidase [Parapedobacter sp. ISTM3]|uniref:Prolyl oligopeptidase family protein n=1 Tax=Parapedobacter luteus TaxID=623280 RepID=A0A1T5FK44_9SPHI|nr:MULTISPECIES: prolyl oligopeptidase family serine peptidase [Parapedobacter]MBK1442426.1 S9 family peptidase [Parapedobacter sp. ISTM3]SKB96466.1 Prolyl oligopeptidase family protein [Parapedobacter luteus]
MFIIPSFRWARLACLGAGLFVSQIVVGQQADQSYERLQSQFENLQHQFQQLNKVIDDLNWMLGLDDFAYMDKVQLTGPPPAVERNPTGQGAGNPLKFMAYVFIPKPFNPDDKYPLLVLPHDGVHGNFRTAYAHIIKELMIQGYVVVAPEYRGSSGYGRGFYQQIDYGGLENEDVRVSKDFMLDQYSFIDKNRVGIMGWSHGGMITLMNLFNFPKDYKVGFAGVPVSDLIARMGYKNDGYRQLYSADYHLGKSADQNVAEYRKRSPVWNADKLETPLFVHANTNDEDVNVLEVEHLIKSLQAANKTFEYEIFENMPGGHVFDRLDTKKAVEVRLTIYQFLGRYLKPKHPFTDPTSLLKASYYPMPSP